MAQQVEDLVLLLWHRFSPPAWELPNVAGAMKKGRKEEGKEGRKEGRKERGKERGSKERKRIFKAKREKKISNSQRSP